MVYESWNEKSTFELGFKLASDAHPGEVFVLSGDLGAGKTIFAKGFGAGLGVKEDIISPTFNIVHEYKGRIPFYHMDVYRLSGAEEAEDAGLSEYFFGKGICLLEWGEIIKEMLPEDTVFIYIEKELQKGDDYRRITVEGAAQ